MASARPAKRDRPDRRGLPAPRRASSADWSGWRRPGPPPGSRSAARAAGSAPRELSDEFATADGAHRGASSARDDPLGAGRPGRRPDGAGAGRRRRAAVGRGDRPA